MPIFERETSQTRKRAQHIMKKLTLATVLLWLLIGLFSLSTPAQAQTQYIDSFTGGASESETTTAPSSGVKIILIDESGKITTALRRSIRKMTTTPPAMIWDQT
jgi:hypothetical protein